jgi:hypothetical protein
LVRATSDGCESVFVEKKITSLKLIIPESRSGRIGCLKEVHPSGWSAFKYQFFGNRAVRIPDSNISLLFCIMNLVIRQDSLLENAWGDAEN